MKTFVIGDIHGALKAVKQILERASVSSSDTLIFLGDYVDGWSESPQVIDFFMELIKTNNCVFLRGNHDELVLHWLQNNHDNPMWFAHGGESTVNAYKNIDRKTREKHIEFLLQLKNFHLDNHNRLFVHAGFTQFKRCYYGTLPKIIILG